MVNWAAQRRHWGRTEFFDSREREGGRERASERQLSRLEVVEEETSLGPCLDKKKFISRTAPWVRERERAREGAREIKKSGDWAAK